MPESSRRITVLLSRKVYPGACMKVQIKKLFKNEIFLLMFNGVIGYLAFTAIILATLQVPPEAILDSGLKEILLVFEG